MERLSLKLVMSTPRLLIPRKTLLKPRPMISIIGFSFVVVFLFLFFIFILFVMAFYPLTMYSLFCLMKNVFLFISRTFTFMCFEAYDCHKWYRTVAVLTLIKIGNNYVSVTKRFTLCLHCEMTHHLYK